jgi:hypothetical protein
MAGQGKAAYLRDYKQWHYNGRPGLPPQSPDYGLMTYETVTETAEIEAEDRRALGKSHWQYYDPKFHGPLLEKRRKAAAKRGQDGNS